MTTRTIVMVAGLLAVGCNTEAAPVTGNTDGGSGATESGATSSNAGTGTGSAGSTSGNSTSGGSTGGGTGGGSTTGASGVPGPAAGVSAGGQHTCAWDPDGRVQCWGRNNGQLGYGSGSNVGDDETPQEQGDVPVGATVTQVEAGGQHTCALLDTGVMRCWGSNSGGQLGKGSSGAVNDAASAVDVDVGGTVTRIVAGSDHTCALLEGGTVRCWGDNQFGQLGYGHTNAVGANGPPSAEGDVALGGAVSDLAAGVSHTCALRTDGVVVCWGWNMSGELGLGHTMDIGDDETPETAGVVSLGGTATRIAVGMSHSCAVLEGGKLRCWGLSGVGATGYGDDQNVGDDETPADAGDVPLDGTAMAVAAGDTSTCVLLDTGKVRCWGFNQFGQLGNGSTNNVVGAAAATDVPLTESVTELSGRQSHYCGLLDTDGIRCWGFNDDGRLGYGHTDPVTDPSQESDVIVF